MGRYMTELGMTPASRSRVDSGPQMHLPPPTIEFLTIYEEKPRDPLEVTFVPARARRE